MKRRCSDEEDEKYARYGGRGIKVCKRWMNVRLFVKDMGRMPAPGYSIERKHPNKGYYKGNCKWMPKDKNTADTMHGRATARGKRKLLRLGEQVADSQIRLTAKMAAGLKQGGKTRTGRKMRKCKDCGGRSHLVKCQKCFRRSR